MSEVYALNACEIEAIINEVGPSGSYIEKIYQDDYEHLVLRLSKAGRKRYLVINVSSASHVYWLSSYNIKRNKSLRFKELLTSKIANGVIKEVIVTPYERAIMFHVKRGEQVFYLIVLLWAQAANIYLCDENQAIIDAYYRKRGNIAQKQLERYYTSISTPSKQEITIRFTPDTDGSINSTVIAHYQRIKQQKNPSITPSEQRNIESKKWQSKKSAAEQQILAIQKHITTIEQNFFSQHFTEKLAYQEAWFKHQIIVRQLRAKEQQLSKEYASAQKRTLQLQILSSQDEQTLNQEVPGKNKSMWPHLKFTHEGFTILVGQNAQQNDLLLKHYSRGLDFWLHIHQAKGAFVIIKYRKEVKPSSELLLTSCALAHYFSKKRYHEWVEVSYTQVKFLKKSKVPGQVAVQRAQILPYQYNKERIEEVLQSFVQRS